MKFYSYQGCGTCKNALKWAKARGLEVQPLPIREQAPTLEELRYMLQAKEGKLRALFNTSGQTYKEMGLKDKLPTLSEDEALQLLSEHGNLVKRPFVVDPSKQLALLGFKEAEWEAAFK